MYFPDSRRAGRLDILLMGLVTLFPLFARADSSLAAVLEPIRDKYKLPALAGAIFTTDGLVEVAAVGVRKAGTTVPVTTHDLWHLGSDTKAMTATLAGTFVAEKKLSWDAKIVSFFPEIAAQVPASIKNITVGDVLRHQAGLVPDLDWDALSKSGTLVEQRLAAAHQALLKPATAPGTYRYSNTDYVVIGCILEKLGDKPWEELMRARIFKPLGMDSAGFGGTGTIGEIDQPWPHLDTGAPAPSNGSLMDNPAVMGPAGNVHCSMQDWTKFLTDQLRGACGLKALLPYEIYKAIQTAPYENKPFGYALGWGLVDRPWAGGKVLTHSGSNTMNYCNTVLAPVKKFGVAVCSNQGGEQLSDPGNAAIKAMVKRYSSRPGTGSPR